MKTIVKVKTIGLAKLNNAEYTNFSTRVLSLVKQAGTLEPEGGSALGIEEEVLDEDESLLALLGDIVAQSRISDLTAILADLDRQRDDLVVYLFKLLRSKKASPVAAERSAATSLYNLLKPYVGCQNLYAAGDGANPRLADRRAQGGEPAQRGDARARQHPHGIGVGKR